MNSIKSRLSEDTYKRCGKQEKGFLFLANLMKNLSIVYTYNKL
jgi:hypothetical protein